MKLRVECYSGSKADERPVRFRLDDHDYFVEELLDQWYGPDDTYFKVRADDGNFYILRHATAKPEGVWILESFRQNGSGSRRARAELAPAEHSKLLATADGESAANLSHFHC